MPVEWVSFNLAWVKNVLAKIVDYDLATFTLRELSEK